MRKFVMLVTLVMVLSLVFAPGALAAVEHEVTYSTKASGSIQDLAMDLFAQKLDELSGGRIVGKKYVAGTIGGEEELAEAVALGDLGATYAADVLIGNCGGGCLGWLSMPGLVSSYEDVERDVFSKDGWLYKLIDQTMAEKIGLKRLASGDNCFRVLAANKEIKTVADLNGLKVRCGNSWENLQFYERAGAIAVVVPSSETLAAIEQKTVDGAENGILNLRDSGIHNAVSYVLPVNMLYSPASIIVNLEWYNSLSDADKAIVDQAAQAAAEYEIKETRAAVDKLIADQVAAGQWTMLEMTPELTDAFKASADSMWMDATEKYGADIIDTLTSNLK